jgi:hypothetical protein
VWNNAEAPEPPANLNATLKGAVIHRFCETYSPPEPARARLEQSFADVVRSRQAQLADRLDELNVPEALQELWPLAENYLASDVYQRAEQARRLISAGPLNMPTGETGLWSELSFRLRRPWGILTGTIDKLLISRDAAGGLVVEIIDFKTNRISATAKAAAARVEAPVVIAPAAVEVRRGKRSHSKTTESSGQFAFEFSATETVAATVRDDHAATSVAEQVSLTATDYQLQMQAYALAVQELLPEVMQSGGKIKVTLHFVHPNVEWVLPDELLTPGACTQAIDEAMERIIASSAPEDFPVRPARHCRMCSFLSICYAGRQFLAGS